MTFPTVKDTASHESASQASSTSKDIGTTTTCDPAMGHDGILWKDDHVFGKSTTSGMTWAEANSQLQLLREIHVTAQQMVTGDDQVFQQATDLIQNVTSLVRLTESAQSRQTPSWAYNSVSDYDSAHGGREQKKRSKKTSRRADHTKDRNSTRTLPRHLQSRSSGSQMPYTWSSVPSGCPPMHANNYAFGSPSSAAPVTYPYSTGYQQPYHAAQTENHPAHDMSSIAPGGMWSASVSDLQHDALRRDIDACLFCQYRRPQSMQQLLRNVPSRRPTRLVFPCHSATSLIFAARTGSTETVPTGSAAISCTRLPRLIKQSPGIRSLRWKTPSRAFTCKSIKTSTTSRTC